MGKFLFIIANILVVSTLLLICSLLGVDNYIGESGINFISLGIFSLVIGFTGSIFSLLISRWMAIKMTKATKIDPQNSEKYQYLVDMVTKCSNNAKLPKLPQIAVYQSDEINAFATGPSKSKSLVAFSSALLQEMSKEEVEGVVGHEIAHIASGDMVSMTLLQGVVNTFAIFFSRIVAYTISNFVDEKLSGIVWFVSRFVLYAAFCMLGGLVVCWYSRKREFIADKMSANITDKEYMIAALKKLDSLKDKDTEDSLPEAVQAFGICSKKTKFSFMKMYSTHPPLADRINALK